MRRVVGRISGGKFVSEEPASVSRLDDMLAARRGPALGTDTHYFAGVSTEDPFEGMSAEKKAMCIRKAKEAGVDIRNKRYISGLALETGDPRAWVENRGDMQRLAEERNMTVEGIVKHTAEVNAEPRSTYEPAADIVEDRAVEILDAQGAPDIVSRKEYELAEEQAYNSLLP